MSDGADGDWKSRADKSMDRGDYLGARQIIDGRHELAFLDYLRNLDFIRRLKSDLMIRTSVRRELVSRASSTIHIYKKALEDLSHTSLVLLEMHTNKEKGGMN